MGLRYIGNASIAGIPARDLSDEEVARYGRRILLASGMYAEYPKPRPAAKASAGGSSNKSLPGGRENKAVRHEESETCQE